MKTDNDLFKLLDDLEIKTKTIVHVPVHTVAEAQSVRGTSSGSYSKNLFLKDKKKQLYLVVCLEDRVLDLKKLKGIINSSHLSFAKPFLLKEILGVNPGSVSPFSLINDTNQLVKLILDNELMRASLLNFHPLINTKTTQIKSSDLLRFVDACGHQVDIKDM